MSSPDVYLGVLAARRNSARRPYHEQTTFFRRLINEGREIGVGVFIFSPPDVLWKRKKIKGWTWTGKRWVRRLFPFPHAIYDRVSPKGKADLGGVPTARRRFRRLGIPRFNTEIGSKWRMHRLFSKNPTLREVLPPTKLLTTSTLAAMMNRYGAVYSKPVRGGQGKGIVWAARRGSGYTYRIQGMRGGARSGKVKSLAALRARCGRGRRIIQRAIPILRCGGRPFDVRALVQRLEDGEFHVTGVVARLGAKGSRVTNIHAGGKALLFEEALTKAGLAPEQIEPVRRRIEALALEVARCLSDAGSFVGELGVDFAIDTDTNVWLLEANSRTGRISFHRAGLTDAARQADRAPAAFARYLAGAGAVHRQAASAPEADGEAVHEEAVRA